MAKNVGLIGGVSGKVGNVVYATVNGVQTVRVYQPNVFNPKSVAQTAQRAKMSLAGRLSSLLTNEMLQGINAPSRRNRRARFVSKVIRAATFNDSVGNGFAKVQPDALVFSEGSVTPFERTTTLAVAQGSTNRVVNVSVTIAASASDAEFRPAGYGERIIVLAIDNSTSQYDVAVMADAVLPAAGASATTRIPMYSGLGWADHEFFVYVVPYVDTAIVSPSDYSYLGVPDDGIIVSVDSDTSVLRRYGDSIYEGYVALNP